MTKMLSEMKDVGVSEEAFELFKNVPFLQALQILENDEALKAEKHNLLELWYCWLLDTIPELGPWLLLAQAKTHDSGLCLQAQPQPVHLTYNQYINWCIELGEEAFRLLDASPFLTTLTDDQSDESLTGFLSWACSDHPAVPNTLGRDKTKTSQSNTLVFVALSLKIDDQRRMVRELQADVVELASRMFQQIELTENRIVMAAYKWFPQT